MKTKLKAKKSLGQNFLRSKGAIDKIANSISEIYRQDLINEKVEIIEIGGGEGIVTLALLEKGYKVNVIEIDQRAIEMMSVNESLSSYSISGKLKILHADVLEADFSEIVNIKNIEKKYIVIGNIPYYITGLIFRKIFEQSTFPLEATLMVQKEVAERVIANDGKSNILSLSVKVYGQPKMLSTVKAGSFTPAPKVDSAILHIANIENKFINKIEEEKFFLIMKTAFKHPRKIALSNLKKYLNKEMQIENIEKYFTENNLQQKRAEDIPLLTWLDLIKL